jgi:adenylate cyclase
MNQEGNSRDIRWLSSTEVLDKARISRATLNNYIKMGLIPKPVVKRPSNPDSKAKKIGFFPESVLDSISTVQLMKGQSKSMDAIVKHLTTSNVDKSFVDSGTEEVGILNNLSSHAKDNRFDSISIENDGHSSRDANLTVQTIDDYKLTINDVQCPAFLINNKFEIEWINKEAEVSLFHLEVSRIREASDRNIFKLFSKIGLLTGEQSKSDLLAYMMNFVKLKCERKSLAKLYSGIMGNEILLLEGIYDRAESISTDFTREAYINVPEPEGKIASYHLYHVVFREGIFCIFAPMDEIFQGVVELLSSRGKVIRDLLKQRMPTLVSFCVLVADLQASSRICAELPPEEYFELIRDMWKCMDGSFQKHYGTYGKHVGDGMVYYFLKDRDDNYIFNSILCAIELREKMKKLSMEWKVRKGWGNDLYLNIGLNEGQEYFGNIPSSPNLEFTALGDSVNYAGRLSDLARYGSIWTTKNLLNRLDMESRKKIQYGIKRNDNNREILVENIFSRVMDMLRQDDPKYSKFMDIATLAVTEIFSVNSVRTGL